MFSLPGFHVFPFMHLPIVEPPSRLNVDGDLLEQPLAAASSAVAELAGHMACVNVVC
jgi:hypothetical protein